MKKITMFILRSCPYCKQALRWMDELITQNSGYRQIEIEILDEREYPDIADSHDYYYVPTFYIGDTKLHEGAASKDKVRLVLEAAMEV